MSSYALFEYAKIIEVNMAQRRMFSLKILNSGKFLKMPMDTQNLYFHLALRADDDGVVEAYSTMRLLGSAEDNLKVLDAKGFIKILNDDLVSFIVDWHEHNNIRADRKIDSIYQNLLIEILPEVNLIEPKERADRPKKKDGTSQGQPKDGIGKDRVGKVKLGKDRTDYCITDSIIDYFNNKTGKQLRHKDTSRKPIIARLNEGFTFDDCKRVIDVKYSEWNNTDFEKYIRISTLFGNKFEVYLNQEVEKKRSPEVQKLMDMAFKGDRK